MARTCSSCNHYEAITGEPAAGWCRFMARNNLPFWMESHTTDIEKMGADVRATDGAECPVHEF